MAKGQAVLNALEAAALETQSADRGEWLLFSLPNAVEERLSKLAHGEFTGEQIRRDHPELFQVVVRMGNEGLSLRIAQRLTGLSKNTVAAIYQSNCVGTAAQNAELARRARQCLTLLFDDFERRLETAQLEETKDLAVLAGILLDKLALLQGGPTATILHRHEVKPGFEDYLSQLRQVQMGLGGAPAEQIGGAPALPPAAGSDPSSAGARTVIEMATDAETVASVASNREGAGDDTDSVADRREPGDGKAGGEGVRVARAAGGGGGITPSRNFEQRADVDDTANGSRTGAQGASGADSAGSGGTPADPP